MGNLKPQVNNLYPTAFGLDDAMNRIKAALNYHDPNQVHAAVMLYHNTLIKEMLKDAGPDYGGTS